ncbi:MULTISPECIES: hypothetical protein [unclassified Streptomyces]|uniref:hypothetical protein n=1 Tax=unclassified Streptomyces TaxID=2593676 RepID=UPI000939BCF3|nr:hypothetical protein [Streptomyces sp. TSRI0281]OKI32677.1 hypothetical protein A6A29_19515 [Streptomyces sp. TSRI0281]
MGLMSWLRGGRSTSGAVPVAAQDARTPAPRDDRVDVHRLVPMQRTLAGQELVSDPSGFEQSLSTRQDTALGTPLGHLVSPDAPAGLVHGLTAPAPVSPQPSPTAQRSVEMPMRVETVPVQRVYAGGAPAMTSAGERAVADLPVRRLVGEQPLVPQSALPRPGDAGPSGSGAVQRGVEPPAAEPARRAPGLGAPLAGLPPTAQRSAAASVPGSGAGSGGGAGSEGGAVAVPVSRSAEDGSGVPEVAVPAVPAVPDEGPEPPSVGTDMGGPTAPLLGDDPLVGAVSGAVPGGVSGAVPRGVGGEADGAAVQRSTGTPGASGTPVAPGPPHSLPTAPLLGDRPLALRTTAGPEGAEAPIGPVAQRSPEGPSGAVAGAGHGAGPLGVPDAVPVRWTTAGTGVGTGTGAYAGAPAVQRAVVASPGAPSAASRLPVQRRTGGRSPGTAAGFPPGGGSRSAFPTAGAFAVAAGVAQRMPDGSVVFGPPSATSASPPSGTSRPVVQRDAEITEEPPPPDPVPDTATEPEPEPDAEPGSESSSGDAAGAPAARAGGGGAPGQAGAPPVTDELVRALYAPLSRLLKADLRLERERAGFLINTRH